MGWPFDVPTRLGRNKMQALLGEGVNLAVLGAVFTAVVLNFAAPWWVQHPPDEICPLADLGPPPNASEPTYEEAKLTVTNTKRRRLGGVSIVCVAFYQSRLEGSRRIINRFE